jgi:hypothetical protein
MAAKRPTGDVQTYASRTPTKGLRVTFLSKGRSRSKGAGTPGTRRPGKPRKTPQQRLVEAKAIEKGLRQSIRELDKRGRGKEREAMDLRLSLIRTEKERTILENLVAAREGQIDEERAGRAAVDKQVGAVSRGLLMGGKKERAFRKLAEGRMVDLNRGLADSQHELERQLAEARAGGAGVGMNIDEWRRVLLEQGVQPGQIGEILRRVQSAEANAIASGQDPLQARIRAIESSTSLTKEQKQKMILKESGIEEKDASEKDDSKKGKKKGGESFDAFAVGSKNLGEGMGSLFMIPTGFMQQALWVVILALLIYIVAQLFGFF